METNKIESFTAAINRAEDLERKNNGVTDEVLAIRKWAKEKYPELFAQYLQNKSDKAGGHGETIRSNFYGQQRMDYLKRGDYNKLKP